MPRLSSSESIALFVLVPPPPPPPPSAGMRHVKLSAGMEEGGGGDTYSLYKSLR